MTLDSTDEGFQGCGGLQRPGEFLTDLLLLGPAAVVNILSCEVDMDSLTLCDCWIRPAARHLRGTEVQLQMAQSGSTDVTPPAQGP
jgi:hypothetical protein